MRRFVCLLALGLALALCQTASAQETPKTDVFLGYSYIRAHPATSGAPNLNLHGGAGQLAYNFNDYFGVVGDFGGYRVGKVNGVNVNSSLFTYLFGPRLNYRKSARFTPFAQVLFGGTHAGSGTLQSGSENAFAMSFGGGLDVHPSKHIGVRLGQVEYLMSRFRETSNNRLTQNNVRVSTGILFRF